jgi:hypothetical protein
LFAGWPALHHVAVLSRQLLLSAKQQLEAVVHEKLEEAVAARDHAAVLRFVLLHQPLAIPEKGISRWVEAVVDQLHTVTRLSDNMFRLLDTVFSL